MGSKGQTEVIGLGSECLYLLSHLSDPGLLKDFPGFVASRLSDRQRERDWGPQRKRSQSGPWEAALETTDTYRKSESAVYLLLLSKLTFRAQGAPTSHPFPGTCLLPTVWSEQYTAL